jgi:hypothetical protein
MLSSGSSRAAASGPRAGDTTPGTAAGTLYAIGIPLQSSTGTLYVSPRADLEIINS